jgi:ATP-dependent Clp protease ATP-binding subunit ClpC
MNLTLTVLTARRGADLRWFTLGLGPYSVSLRGTHEARLKDQLVNQLRAALAKAPASELDRFDLVRGRRVETVKLALSLRGEGRRRKHSLSVPLVVEPRWASDDARLVIAYHPMRQSEWFAVDDEEALAALASTYFSEAWAELDDDTLASLAALGKVGLKAVAFSITPRSLLDALPPRREDGPDDPRRAERDAAEREKLARRGGYRILPSLGENLTRKAADGGLDGGLARGALRDQLRMLLGGPQRTPTVLVGESGVGKSVALARWVLDLLDDEHYPVHRNADRVSQVWRLAGKRLIAGMSYLGDWEQRCVDVLEDVRNKRCVLYADDLHLWGRIGRARDSDRNLAEFFHGPVARRELLLVGECTPAQWRQLEEDAPAFAGLFTRLTVQPADEAETFRLLVHTMRALEPRWGVRFTAGALRMLLELGASLVPNRALPGKVLDLLGQLARDHGAARTATSSGLSAQELLRPLGAAGVRVDDAAVVDFMARRTGLSQQMLSATPMTRDEVEAALTARVMGQPAAVSAAAEVLVRVRSGMVDPGRPYGVLLLTGPTGTGKTELARAIAQQLYGDESRLLRFDMGEYGTPDAAARLVGDRWTPEGLLTRAVTQQPFCVVLFDEVEKAHPQVHNLLLQLLDEGRLTDATGATARFTHAVIVLTSNLGARSRALAGFTDDLVAQGSEVLRAVQEFFAPELFNRIDKVVALTALSPTAARAVAAKELGKLTARRGLVDRHVFVTASPAVLDRVVSEAFRAADGARSLKRYLEDRIGSLLTRHLVTAPPAELQLVRVGVDDAGFTLAVEALRESPPLAGDIALEALVNAPQAALEAAVAEAVAFTAGLSASPALAALSAQVREHLALYGRGVVESAEALYTLDAMRVRLDAYRARLEGIAERMRREEDWEVRGLEIESAHTMPPSRWDNRQPRTFDRRAVSGHAAPPLRAEILDALSERYALARALPRVGDPDEHAVFVELSRATPPELSSGGAEAGQLFLSLAMAYAGAAVHAVTAEVAWLPFSGVLRAVEAPDALLVGDCAHGASRLVLRLVGLCVRDYFTLETGTHVWHHLGGAPELVRVVVSPAPPGQTASDALRSRLAAIAAAEGAAEPALPVVRVLRFDPPRGMGVAPIEVEDFPTGLVRAGTARTLAEPLPQLWALRTSRSG